MNPLRLTISAAAVAGLVAAATAGPAFVRADSHDLLAPIAHDEASNGGPSTLELAGADASADLTGDAADLEQITLLFYKYNAATTSSDGELFSDWIRRLARQVESGDRTLADVEAEIKSYAGQGHFAGPLTDDEYEREDNRAALAAGGQGEAPATTASTATPPAPAAETDEQAADAPATEPAADAPADQPAAEEDEAQQAPVVPCSPDDPVIAENTVKVRALFDAYGVTIASHGETEAERLARIAEEVCLELRPLTGGVVNGTMSVEESIRRIKMREDQAAEQQSLRSTPPAGCELSGDDFYTLTRKVELIFNRYDVAIASHGETEAERLARIAGEVCTGKRNLSGDPIDGNLSVQESVRRIAARS